MDDRLITFSDAAELIGPGVTARAVRTWFDKGWLKAIKVGRSWRTTMIDIEVCIAVHKQAKPCDSSYTVPIITTAPQQRDECGHMSGTSRGTKESVGLTEALAASLILEAQQKKDRGLKLRPKSNSVISLSSKGNRPRAHVIQIR